MVTLTTHVDETLPVASGDPTACVHQSGDMLRAGARVGRYVIDAHVGAGGMGRIYTAHDPELQRKVALKLLRAERNDELGRERLLREARALAKLAHPHVVSVHDVGTVGEQIFVAMEYVSGTTLTKALAQRRYRWREVLELLLPVAHGLAAVHAVGLVHRDLKPDNLMIGDDGRVRVVDFGLARAPTHIAEDEDPRGRTLTSAAPGTTLTGAGALLGTPPYMAPEQWHGLAADARTDQFAYCVTLWEALYGERPYGARSIMELERTISAGIRSPAATGVVVPRWLHAVLERGLAVEPSDRYPSMDALIDVLVRGRRRGRWLATAIALASMATVGVVVGLAVDLGESAVRTSREPLAVCEGSEVCAQGPFSVPVCTTGARDAVREGRPCEPSSPDDCSERESCVTVERRGGEVSSCMLVCEIHDDRPACVPGCYNQDCAGGFDLCAREHGTCRPVPCTIDDDCSAAEGCDYSLRGSPGLRCNSEAGFCERKRG